MKILNQIYTKILKKGRDLYKEADCEKNINTAQRLESYSMYLNEMNDKLEIILDLTDKYSNECIDKATEIRNFVDINDKYKDDPSRMFLAHKELYQDMSWSDIADIEDKKEELINEVNNFVKKPFNKHKHKHKHIMYKDISNIYGVDLGFNSSIPIINKLNEMPSAMYWYGGDKNNPAGIYTCLTRKFYVQIPLPNVVDGTKDFDRTNSIKCKYNTKEECVKIRDNLSKKYNSDVRVCKFAHSGDKYIKIGTVVRCPNIPRFGNHIYLKNDLDNLPDSDVKILLMHSLSDLLLSSLWFQKQDKPNIVFTKIDVC